MKRKEQNLNNENVSYQCNFVLLPRQEKIKEPGDASGRESAEGCSSAEKKDQNKAN